MTTFFKRFPARRNRTVHSGLILELLHSGLLFELKEKIRRIGGCKGRSPRVYLTGKEHGEGLYRVGKRVEETRQEGKSEKE